MNRTIPIMAKGIEHMRPEEVAQLICDIETENAKLRKELADMSGSAKAPTMAQEPNRVLTLKEVRAMKNGDVVWVENIDKPTWDGQYVRRDDRLLSTSLSNSWNPFFGATAYLQWYRAWLREPTASESASVPWRE